jgi:hypothetical protein
LDGGEAVEERVVGVVQQGRARVTAQGADGLVGGGRRVAGGVLRGLRYARHAGPACPVRHTGPVDDVHHAAEHRDAEGRAQLVAGPLDRGGTSGPRRRRCHRHDGGGSADHGHPGAQPQHRKAGPSGQ